MQSWQLIDDNTPRDRPILVGEKCTPHRSSWKRPDGSMQWNDYISDPYGFVAAVAVWNKRHGYWELMDCPQGCVDHKVPFGATHWAEIPEFPDKGVFREENHLT